MPNCEELNDKQKRFCHEYIKDHNGKQAAIRAGYAEKSAEMQASRLLSKDKVYNYYRELENELLDSKIMTAKEIRMFLTSVARGEITDEVWMIVNGKPRKGERRSTTSDRIRAVETLSKILDRAEELQRRSDSISVDQGARIEFVITDTRMNRDDE